MVVISNAIKGCGVDVISRKHGCTINLYIPSHHVNNHRKLHAELSNLFILDAKFSCKGGTYPEGITIHFEENYPRDDKGILVSTKTHMTLKFEGPDYYGSLQLFVNAYLPCNRIGNIRKSRKGKL